MWEKECIHQDRLGFAEIINVSKFQQLSITKLDFQLTQDQGQVTSSLFHLRTRGLGSLHLCCHHFNIWLSASPGQRKREFMDYTLALKCLIWEMICATKVCISLSRTSHTAPANWKGAGECGQHLKYLMSTTDSAERSWRKGLFWEICALGVIFKKGALLTKNTSYGHTTPGATYLPFVQDPRFSPPGNKSKGAQGQTSAALLRYRVASGS